MLLQSWPSDFNIGILISLLTRYFRTDLTSCILWWLNFFMKSRCKTGQCIFLCISILRLSFPLLVILSLWKSAEVAQFSHRQNTYWLLALFYSLKIYFDFSGGLSAAIPHLDLLISLIGALASSFLALIMPAVIELVTFQPGKLSWLKNIGIITLGLIGFGTGTVTSLIEIVKTFWAFQHCQDLRWIYTLARWIHFERET